MITAGRGWYQEWGKPARELRAGDVGNIPPEVKHWRGAARDSWFAHLAVEVPGVGTSNEWLESVSDADYGKQDCAPDDRLSPHRPPLWRAAGTAIAFCADMNIISK